MKTTLNKIRSFSPCKYGWNKLLNGLGKTEADDEELAIARKDAVYTADALATAVAAYDVAAADAAAAVAAAARQGIIRKQTDNLRSVLFGIKGAKGE